MSYISQGERIFNYQDPKYADCSPPLPKRSDHRLKRFHSTSDKRAWAFCDDVRYSHLYDLVSGSQTCLDVGDCHKYVPLEDLIRILMYEKEARLKELEDMLKNLAKNNIGDAPQNQNIKSKEFDSREILRKAIHKLENIHEIMNENKNLHCRLRCSEERIKRLEQKKKQLEIEVSEFRSKSQILLDLEATQAMLQGGADKSEDEKRELMQKVNCLEKELEECKRKENEIELLKNQSDNLSIEEMVKENECFKQKLSSMKCLERQIQELKKQAIAMANKYKRESEKAAEQMKKMCNATKELQALRQEKDNLLKRVQELSSHECQYKALQQKLKRVDEVIAENQKLSKKLLALDRLEKENEYLRCKLEQIQEMEMSAIEDKERICELQNAVTDQEEEMKDMLSLIEKLSNGNEEEELERLKCELYDKNSKLKLCEQQLAEIPMLEAEIDELRKKLQCCCKDLSQNPKAGAELKKIPIKSTKCNNECSKKSAQKNIPKKSGSCHELFFRREKADPCNQKDVMSCEEVQSLLKSSKGIISCVLEDMIEHHKEMVELESCNKAMKNEIEILKKKITQPNEVENLKKIIREKDAEIQKLKCQTNTDICNETCNDNDDETDIETLKDLNREMKEELEAAQVVLKQVANLEKLLDLERQARCNAETMLKEQEEQKCSKALAGEGISDGEIIDCYKALKKETSDLKCQIIQLNKLTEELKKENALLREMQQPCPDFSKELDEKCALENLLSLLQAELDAYKSKNLSGECKALRCELKRIMEQNCQLKALVRCYRQRLDLEKKPCSSAAKSAVKPEVEQEAESETETEADGQPGVKQKGPCPPCPESSPPPPCPPCPEIPPPPPAVDTGEIDRLKKLLEEKEQARINELKALQANLDRMTAENSTLKTSLTEAKAKAETAKKEDDCLERLKQMEKENAEKLKKLMDQHEKVLQDREKAYNENMNSLKAGYESDIRKMAERHKGSINRLQSLHEDEVNELNTNHEVQMETMQTQSENAIKDVARGSVAKMKKLSEEHEKQMKEANGKIKDLEDTVSVMSSKTKLMKACNQKRLSLMKCKYEGQIDEERRKSESLQKCLNEKSDVCKKSELQRDPRCPLNFNEVLQKILAEGLSCLTFNEIALVHRKACCALKEMVLNSKVCPAMEPPVGGECAMLQGDKQQLMQRIFTLESDIINKQKQTQNSIIEMEAAVRKERCRLQELKKILHNEQQENSNLKMLLTSQTKIQTDLKEERDRLGSEVSKHQSLCKEASMQLNQEKKDKECLQSELIRLKETVRKLYDALEAERKTGKTLNQNDCSLIQSLRFQLEQSIRQKQRLAFLLQNEERSKIELQRQLQGMNSLRTMVNLPAVEKQTVVVQAPLEVKNQKDKPSCTQIKERKRKLKVTSRGGKARKVKPCEKSPR